jgi:hypothetical protein
MALGQLVGDPQQRLGGRRSGAVARDTSRSVSSRPPRTVGPNGL